MKTLILIWFLTSVFAVTCKSQVTVSTFSGHSIHYGWNDRKSFSEAEFRKVIDTCFSTNVPALDMQAELDKQEIKAELLWKISGDIDEVSKLVKDTTSSWIWSDAKPTSFNLVFKSDGSGYIYLYQGENTVGKVRCHTSSKKGGDKYLQLKEGSYHVEDKKPLHISKEKGLEGSELRHALFSGVDGKWIHEGEIAPSHGCVRVSKPAMKELYRLIGVGTLFGVKYSSQ